MNDTETPPAVVEADVTVSMLKRVNKILERADLLINQDPRDVAKLTDQEKAAREHEIEQATQRAAELIAKYNIDRAMLQASGTLADETVDRVFMAERPFAKQFNDLYAVIARNKGAKLTYISSWNPKSGPIRRGGIPAGGFDYGYRVFTWESDLLGIDVLYAHVANQARVQVAEIRDFETKFGQRQKAMRESWLDGFVAGVNRQLTEAKRVAEQKAQAEHQEAIDRALESGDALPPMSDQSVALVLANRAQALSRAYDAAQGITPEQRAAWAKQNEEWSAEWREQQEKRKEEIANCSRCKKAKTGRCNTHRIKTGRTRHATERIGDAMGMWSAGHAAGRAADLGAGPAVSNTSRVAI